MRTHAAANHWKTIPQQLQRTKLFRPLIDQEMVKPVVHRAVRAINLLLPRLRLVLGGDLPWQQMFENSPSFLVIPERLARLLDQRLQSQEVFADWQTVSDLPLARQQHCH